MGPLLLLLLFFLVLVVARLLIGLAAGTLLGSKGVPLKTMIVLGSGGHTAEMMALLRGLDTQAYAPRCYVVAETDKMSAQKANTFEAELLAASAAAEEEQQQAQEQQAADGTTPAAAAALPGVRTRLAAARQRRALQEPQQAQPQQPAAAIAAMRGSEPQQRQQQRQQYEQGGWEAGGSAGYKVIQIPRSREVGQSFRSSIWSTLWALGHALGAVLTSKPDLVLVNGPGTCIPICMAAVLARLLGLARGRIVYVESIARVYRLSLTGKILYHARMADTFFVQWPDLQARYPRCAYAGRVM